MARDQFFCVFFVVVCSVGCIRFRPAVNSLQFGRSGGGHGAALAGSCRMSGCSTGGG